MLHQSSRFKFAYISFSVSKTTRELLLEWNHLEPVDLSSDLKMPQFKVEEVETDICEESSLIGKFVCINNKQKIRWNYFQYL